MPGKWEHSAGSSLVPGLFRDLLLSKGGFPGPTALAGPPAMGLVAGEKSPMSSRELGG